MTGWNLPPGCNVSDLPGNTREDERNEAIYDRIYAFFDEWGIEEKNESMRDKCAEALFKFIGEVYHEAYGEGMGDEGIETSRLQEVERELKQRIRRQDVMIRTLGREIRRLKNID